MRTLETERLILRPWQESDSVNLYNICLDAELRKSGVSYYNNVEDSLKTIRLWKERSEMLAIICKENDRLIGLIGLGDMNRYSGYKELECAIAADYRNKGYGVEALGRMVDYAFNDLGSEVIAAWVRSHNKASSRMLEKCAFVHEGTLRKHARDKSDTMCYSLLRDEWETKREITYYNALPYQFDGFIDIPKLSDDNIELVCTAKKNADPVKKYVPAYIFEIRKSGQRVGELGLRIGYTDGLYFGGQIGYAIDEQHRGNGYAAAACRLVLPVARAHGMSKLLITNDVNNTESRRVCEKLGLRLVRVARLPEWTELYRDGQRYVNIYEWILD